MVSPTPGMGTPPAGPIGNASGPVKAGAEEGIGDGLVLACLSITMVGAHPAERSTAVAKNKVTDFF